MKEMIKNTNLRFNLEKEEQKKAWDYLQNMDRQEFKSYSQAITKALNYYFDRYYHVQDDPYFETREREELFVTQIIDTVHTALEQVLPYYISGCLAGVGLLGKQPPKDTATVYTFMAEQRPLSELQNEELIDESSDIDWNFLGE